MKTYIVATEEDCIELRKIQALSPGEAALNTFERYCTEEMRPLLKNLNEHANSGFHLTVSAIEDIN